GSDNNLNIAKATMDALVSLKDAKNVAKLRGKSVVEMYSQRLQPREVISNEIK
ncbi:30S ribosomal protein S5, partial [bacterium]|nr:30S ribosomal protein S5 [bacterium]